ncbi:DUF1127 domain-containing protein [Dongia deserti]|uniref:DUF1127 domain-containing protein n=1 Tax=Dongia deserti TaxID=2268030 RepID=UPI000E65E2D1|nr:DUF1127 domain-containing protein [Dongia deserti]
MTMRFAYDGAAAYVEPRSSFPTKLSALLSAVTTTLRLWARRHHDRRDLLRLDDHMLRDIGLDRSRAGEMASRPFWQA